MSSTLVFPQLGGLYEALGPWAEALLRAVVGLALVPHALRACFGFFPESGGVVKSFAELADYLDHAGYRPGRFWGAVIAAIQLVGGPLLALGLFTRAVSLPIFVFLALAVHHHWRNGWFWNQRGSEFLFLWAVASLYFLVNGGGAVSLDRWLGWEF